MLDKLLSPESKVLYFAVLLILLLVIVWFLRTRPSSEHLAKNQVYTSGATQRVIGTLFSEPTQGEYDITYNDEIKDWKDYKKPDNYMNAYSEHFSVYRDPYNTGKKKMNF